MSGLPERTRSSATDGDLRQSHDDQHESHLGATRNLSAVRQDLHDLARLARSGSALTACIADSRPVSASPQVIPSSKPHRTAKIRSACPIPPPCADGHNGDCSAYAAGLRPGRDAAYFFRPPTIVAWDLGALCRILPIEARSP